MHSFLCYLCLCCLFPFVIRDKREERVFISGRLVFRKVNNIYFDLESIYFKEISSGGPMLIVRSISTLTITLRSQTLVWDFWVNLQLLTISNTFYYKYPSHSSFLWLVQPIFIQENKVLKINNNLNIYFLNHEIKAQVKKSKYQNKFLYQIVFRVLKFGRGN